MTSPIYIYVVKICLVKQVFAQVFIADHTYDDPKKNESGASKALTDFCDG